MDVAKQLAGFWAHTGYQDLPSDAVDSTKRFMVDSLGAALAGSGIPGNAAIMDLLAEWGGRPQSTVMIYGLRTPAPDAVFANSILIHSADYDDTDDRTATHTNVTVLPAALAAAELTGADGQTVIRAVTLGVDFTCRLALAAHLFHGWHTTTTVGVFGAAAAAGIVLGLSEQELVNALGIAYSQASGNRQGRHDGAQTKRIQPPFAAKAGFVSALLAQRGITGAQKVFQGPWGFFRLYRDPQVAFDPDAWGKSLTRELGERFENTQLAAKPYPCVRCSHAPIDGALALFAEQRPDPQAIESVTVKTNERVLDTAGSPFQIRTNPEVDAKFSIPYVVAVALIRGRITLQDFKEETIRQQEVLDLAGRVRVEVVPELADSVSVVGPVELEVAMENGGVLRKRIELAKGHPDNPMSEEEAAFKLKDCAAQSVKAVPERDIAAVLERCAGLEAVRDIGAMLQLLCP